MRTTSKSGQGLSRKVIVGVGLVVLIAVDVVLIALAFGWGRPEPQAAEATSPSQTVQPDVESDRAEREPQSPSDVVVDTPQDAPRLLSATSESVAWRSDGGACDERGSLELTVDGGQTWGAAYPAADGLGRPLWVSGTDYTAVQSAVAVGTECGAQGVRTFDSGASWTQDDQVTANSVLVDPSDPSVVILGGNVIQGPCGDMNQVVVTGGVSGVLCGDGTLWSSPIDATDWTQSGVENAVALGGSDGRWVAAVESDDCEGLSLVEFSEAPVESLACVPAEPEGQAALDMSGNSLWLWAGDEIMVSTDLGRSFN